MPCKDAPRAGSAEAKAQIHPVLVASLDAPRAGSAEAKYSRKTGRAIDEKMHPVQAAPRQR